MFEILLKNIARALDKRRVPYIIIGGQAVLLYGTPRLTRDIDITLGIDVDKTSLVKDLCSELKLKILPKDIDVFVAKTMVMPAEDPKTKIRVDFIFSFSEYEQDAIKRAKRVKINGYRVAFASVEDLIIHKIFSGRAIDLEDIKNVLIKVGLKKIDLLYIKRWLAKFQKASGRKDMISLFRKILADSR